MENEKREAQKKNREKAMRQAELSKNFKWIGFAIAGLIILGIVAWAVATSVVIETPVVEDYSAGLNEDGTIKGVHALDYVELFDYKHVVLSKSDVEVSQEELDSHIESLVSNYPTLNKDTSLVAKDGDTVNIDYVGKVDDVPFDGGSTKGAGTDLKLGSGSYIPGFEDQVIGHQVGETFDINVTFPEEYGSADLAGKDAVFTITINGIQQYPAFDDAFVKANLSDVASTAAEYKEYYAKKRGDEKIYNTVYKILNDNINTKDYPKKYLKIMKGLAKSSDAKNYQNSLANGHTTATSVADYYGYSQKEYEANLSSKAMSNMDGLLLTQAIYEDAGLTVTDQDVLDFLIVCGFDESYLDSLEETYGKGYLRQAGMSFVVTKYIASIAKIED